MARQIRGLPIFLLALTVASVPLHSQTANTTIPQDIPEKYRTAEQGASEQYRKDLDTLRREGRDKGWKFKIGYTSVFATPLDQLATTQIPDNFLAMAIAQNEFAKKANGVANESARLAGVPTPDYLGTCRPSLNSFNWRDEKMLTKVVNQKGCGSCWAFAATATYDGAYMIRNGRSVETSQQYVLDCAVGDDGLRAGTCHGGWYDPAFQWMVARGVSDVGQSPYLAKESTCPTNAGNLYRAVSWGFVTDKRTVPLISELKRAICEYGPIASATEITDAFRAYIGGFFNEGSQGTINHAVTITGWDDNAGGTGVGGWLVKNSWDTDWGEDGYIWMAYSGNKIGYAAAWVRPVEESVSIPTNAIASAWEQARPRFASASVLADPALETGLGKLPAVAGFPTHGKEGPTPHNLPVVWIQYGRPDQKAAAENLQVSFTKAGYFAPAVEDVRKKGGRLPNHFEVRYFTPGSSEAAASAAKVVAAAGLGPVNIKKPNLKGATKISAIEVWFPEDASGR